MNLIYSYFCRKIACKHDITQAVYDVYDSGVVFGRARNGRGKYALLNDKFRKDVENVLNQIGECIYGYFNLEPNTTNNQANFDSFHNKLCNLFLIEINKIRNKAKLIDNSYEKMSYGQAQKLINLSYKYISTYSDYNDFADLFSYCHMTIDSIVIKNLTRNNLNKIFNCNCASSVSKNKGGWTNYDYIAYKALVDAYRIAINPIRKNDSYMQIEYCLWPKMQQMPNANAPAPRIHKFHINSILP